ncbi:unnamed protein product [Caenorhabditis brenneri]
MSAASVSLESLQFLFQNMDANKRFEIYIRCPSLRDVEISVPLKIYDLMLAKNCVDVNGTRYNLGIVRKCNVGKPPVYVAVQNKDGGVQHEVDRYGILDLSDAITVSAGDVEIRRGMPIQRDDDVMMGRLENRVQVYEAQLAEEQERMPIRNRRAIIRLENTVDDARARLFAYQCRRDNIPPNYLHFLQVTTYRVVNEQEQKTIQRFIHNKKYSEAMKQLTTMLFGGRSCPILVTRIFFNCRIGVIRLPVNVKFHIEQLMFNGAVGTTLEALSPIIHELSYPLKKLGFHAHSVADVQHPVVETSEEVEIKVFFDRVIEIMSTVTNRRVVFNTELPEETLEELIRRWNRLQRPMGAQCVIDFREEHEFLSEMEDILKGLNGVANDDENVIIPVSNETQLNVSYGPFPEFAPCSKWAVKLLNESVDHS